MIFKKKIKTTYLLGFSFVAGLVFWKITPSHKRSKIKDQISYNKSSLNDVASSNKTLVSIDDAKITLKDLEWEYQFTTQNLIENNELKPQKNISNNYSTDFLDLKQKLLSDLVERKVLISFIKKDARFDFDNQVRRRSCLSQLNKLQKENNSLVKNAGVDILKDRICENHLIKQYMNEFIKPKIQISKDDLSEYYKNNKEEFHFKKRVVVRQIVLATEKEARKILPKINKNNFREYLRNHSISPEPNQDGTYGPLEKGQYSGAFDTAFRMRPGQVRGIVKTAYGFQILQLVDKLPAGSQSFEQAKPIIEDKITQKRFAKLYAKFLEDALAASSIKSEEKIW